MLEDWTIYSWYCPNCKTQVAGLKNKKNQIRVICTKCSAEMVRTVVGRRHDVIDIYTFATRMCESGLNVKVVQSVLGHADVTTTLDIYVTVTNDLKKREITAFETYLKTGAKQMANV